MAIAFSTLLEDGAKFLPSLPDSFLKMFVHAIGNQELGVLGPAVHAFRQPDFLFPERFAVSFFGVLPVRRTPADVTVHNNERGTIGGLQESTEAAADQVQIIRICNV